MSLARYEHLMADAAEAAIPDEAYERPADEGVCRVCGGALEGFVGYPGEWPCECVPDYDDTVDIEQYQLRKAESNE